MPLWISVLFRVVGSANLFLSVLGLYYMLDALVRWATDPHSDPRTPYFYPTFYLMCAVNLVFIVMLCVSALDILKLRLASVRLYMWVVGGLIFYDLVVASLWGVWGLPDSVGMSIASATGVGNMGTAPFEFALFFVPFGYPILSTLGLYFARRKMLKGLSALK